MCWSSAKVSVKPMPYKPENPTNSKKIRLKKSKKAKKRKISASFLVLPGQILAFPCASSLFLPLQKRICL